MKDQTLVFFSTDLARYARTVRTKKPQSNILLYRPHARSITINIQLTARNKVAPTTLLLHPVFNDLLYNGIIFIRVVIDASGKPGSGLYGGNTLWYGSYSECQKIPDSRYCLTIFPGSISIVPNKTEVIFYLTM